MFLNSQKTKTVLGAVLGCLLLFGTAFSDEETQGTTGLKRSTPSGQYIDPSSFFRFHGYVTLSNSALGKDLGAETGVSPQILVTGVSPRSGQNESGFKNDAALFVGGEPFGGISSIIEIHFVGDASNPVITEAKPMWDMVGREGGDFTLRSVGGRF